MKIGIDISATIGERTGVGNYTANLVEALAKIDNINEYILYPFFYSIFPDNFKSAIAPSQNNFHIRLKRIPKKIIQYLWNSSFPKKLILGNVDILHSTTYNSPKDHYGKLIVTIYDVSFITYPQYHLDSYRIHCLNCIKDAINYADHIISISNHGKEELVKYFQIAPEKITVTPLAANDIFQPRSNIEHEYVRKKYQIPLNYILFIGAFEPRKNLITLCKAYEKLPESIKKKYSLVIGGGKGWLNSDLYSFIDSRKTSNIQNLGYIDENDLPALYSASTVFVYPSIYEGFGLPILEAMSCGTPVITSNTSSMPEVGGNAAIYFDPTDSNQLKNLLILLINDDSLRKELRYRGIAHAKQFSWEKTAEMTLKIYKETFKRI